MMTSAPKLTDRAALGLHRAQRQDDALFVHALAADQVQERLQMVKKPFSAIAIVTGQPELWQDRFPQARLVADTPMLELEPQAHDLVIHAMALQWADDPVGQVIQCRRALRPDGLFLSVSPGGQTLAELRAVLAQAESNISGGLSPRVVPMMDLRDAGALLQRAGLALPVADAERLSVTYVDALALMRELRAMGEGNALHTRNRRIPPRGLFSEAVRLYGQYHPAADDPMRIHATVELLHLSGWAPDESQPKPLRPGSATTRLADALNTSEHTTKTKVGDNLRDPQTPPED